MEMNFFFDIFVWEFCNFNIKYQFYNNEMNFKRWNDQCIKLDSSKWHVISVDMDGMIKNLQIV